MKFNSLNACVRFLEQEKELVRVTEWVDPNLEMAQITRDVFEAQGPALLFEKIRGTRFPALSNLFGTFERTLKIFDPQLEQVRALVDTASNPGTVLKSPFRGFKALPALAHAVPIQTRHAPVLAHTSKVDSLPLIRCWPGDGGAFVLLPQVFSCDPESDSIFRSNLGMYRVQLNGNDYDVNHEVGLHYQLHRGIGLHHKKALALNRPLRVSIFIGGPPAHALAAVMPLPEGMPEVAFAGALAGRNFRYSVKEGFIFSADADFCITGTLLPGRTKPEGPFGDHLGYYSLKHEYPYLTGIRVFHRPGAIFPFTVVGRPPQEDSNFGKLIHEITRSAVRESIPGVTAINAVDHAGVHPLLLVKAHERYLPYEPPMPRELLTHAQAILGTGQLSLAKYLFITAHEDCPNLDITDEKAFFVHMLQRINFSRDLHFITQTTMDTLDYSSGTVNHGSKLILAGAGKRIRSLAISLSHGFSLPGGFDCPQLAGPGMAVVQGHPFTDYPTAKKEMNSLVRHFDQREDLESIPLVVVVDDARFAARNFSNFLWVTFSRSNPSHDVYGKGEAFRFKHWTCQAPLIIDARIKPFHAAPLTEDPRVREGVKRLAVQGASLHNIL